MSKVARTRVAGSLALYTDGFREELARMGYSAGSAEHHVRLVAHLSRWMVPAGCELSGLTDERVEQFLLDLRAGHRRAPTARTLAPLLGWLRNRGVVPQASPPKLTAVDALLARYRVWLIRDRGLAARTVDRYDETARRFFAYRGPLAAADSPAAGLRSEEVTRFLLHESSRGQAVGSVQGVVASLRALLRFLHVEGLTAGSLADAVPPVAGLRDSRLPPSLAAADVSALLASCDREHPTGIRDYAVLVVLARLGLRAGEVAALQVGDLDWRAGLLVIRGKGRRSDQLPMSTEVGEALAAYLQRTRPRTADRTLFLTVRAPWRPLHPNTVSRIVLVACRRAGVSPVRAHRLRHALATEMLGRGVGLTEIAQVLRHQDLATTAAYARVDRNCLRQVARRWPGAGW